MNALATFGILTLDEPPADADVALTDGTTLDLAGSSENRAGTVTLVNGSTIDGSPTGISRLPGFAPRVLREALYWHATSGPWISANWSESPAGGEPRVSWKEGSDACFPASGNIEITIGNQDSVTPDSIQ